MEKDGDILTEITADRPRIMFTYKMKRTRSQWEALFDARGLTETGLTQLGVN
jgi:hypothetical protein